MADEMVRLSIKLILFTGDDGGRKTPIQNGFRTDMKLNDDEYRMVVLEFDESKLFPGQSCDAICTVLLHSEKEIDQFLEMKSTVIADGPNVIGRIEVCDVLNREDLCW